MKIYMIVFVLLNSKKIYSQSLTNERFRNTRQNHEALTDIRWAPLKAESEKSEIDNSEMTNFHEEIPGEDVPDDTYASQGRPQIPEPVAQRLQNNKDYIQKMANQLFLTQKHVPLLSEYQKFIINQDPLVKKYVFGNQDQATPLTAENSQLTRKARNLYFGLDIRNAGVKPISKKSNATAKNYLAGDLIPETNQLSHLAFPPTPNFNTFKLDSSLTPKFQVIRAIQPYNYYNLAGVGVTQQLVHRIPHATSEPSILHLGYGSHQAFPVHYIETDKHPKEGHQEHVGDGYKFVYDVKDDKKGTDFGHKEVKEHDKTHGYYYLQLPDGRFETVKYWADKTGFHANVEFKGRAVHPEQHSHFHHHQHHHHHHSDV